MMDQEFGRKLVKALRSGKYRQVRKKLYGGGGYCCLGVAACVLTGKSERAAVDACRNEDEELLGTDALDRIGINYKIEEFGINSPVQDYLSKLNDDGASFEKIAEWIEKNLMTDASRQQDVV